MRKIPEAREKYCKPDDVSNVQENDQKCMGLMPGRQENNDSIFFHASLKPL